MNHDNALVSKSAVAFDPSFHLCDINRGLAAAWEQAFAGVERVRVYPGHIFDKSGDAVVSPANCFGHMNGGIDRVYLFRFGDALVVRLKRTLAERFAGELPVGQAVIIPTEDEQIPYMIQPRPTMREIGDVSQTENAYLAFRAVLLVVRFHNANAVGSGARSISNVLCPGLATNTGNMPVETCACKMRRAYDEHCYCER